MRHNFFKKNLTAPPVFWVITPGQDWTQPGWVNPAHSTIHNPIVISHTCKHTPSTHPSSLLWLWKFKQQCHCCREGRVLCTSSTGRRGSVTSAIGMTEQGKAGQAPNVLPPSSALTQQDVYMQLGDRGMAYLAGRHPAAPSRCLRGKYTTPQNNRQWHLVGCSSIPQYNWSPCFVH